VQKYFEKMMIDIDLRGMSEATAEAYLRRVAIFIKHINKPIEDITPEDIRNYVIYLKQDKKLSLGTINAYISAFKFFFSITLEKNWDEVKVPRMKGYNSFPAVLSKDEVLEIIDSVTNLKHKAILMTIYGSGLRVSEVARLKVSDIDSRNMQIHIHKSKNKSDRYAILSKKNLDILRKYWLECGKPKDWMFPGINEGEHISVKTIKNLVIRLKNKLNITKNISAHTFRHCFATHLLEADVQLTHIQHLMGHRSIKSTIRYLHMTSKAMMNIKSPLDDCEE
jgi:site-specific recombinase XerD